ncbi:septum site-determining protein MinC [Trichormus sp. NMC-1]|uniref:septum site-determining protein MinC n=1 Tax=Trichormus sp. NMC-1 TaxID=1853259 RepID=UPI0008DC04DC|nr:septum site-determining protein MinC [Trichormus sp. NMC-1]
MNTDSTNFPKDLELTTESSSPLADAESISKQADVEANIAKTAEIEAENTIIPNTDINSVVLDLQTNSPSVDVESNPVQPNVDSDSVFTDLDSIELALPEQKANNSIQVQLKTEEGRLLLILPTESQVPASELSWSQMWEQMKQRLNAGDRLRIVNTPVYLVSQDRLLDSRQLQELAETLREVKLQLKSVATSRRQTAIAACTLGYSVEQIQLQPSLSSDPQTTPTPLADALYLEMTVRSGGEIRHPGTVIIFGDINPGGIVVADGDILVWGRLRGIAHAGALGNRESLIMALQMEPTQLRIADALARAPEKSLTQFFPEVAYITPQGIRIAKAIDFSRSQFSKINQ